MKSDWLLVYLSVSISSAYVGGTIGVAGANSGESPQSSVPTNTYQLLFIGNSHSSANGLPDLVAAMIEAGSPGSSAHSELAPGSGFLSDRLETAETQQSLESRDWTHVILQAQKYSTSGRFFYPTDAAEEWIRRVKAINAHPILFPEWPRKGNTEEGPRIHDLHLGIASRESACVAPVGLAWEESIKWYPALDLHAADGNHSNVNGATLTAFVFYQLITGQSAAELPPIQGIGVSEFVQRQLRDIAANVVNQDSATCSDMRSQGFQFSAGLNDAWFNPATDGQGYFITVFPDLEIVSLAWFTYDTVLPGDDEAADLGDPGHRWLMATGAFVGDRAELDISITSGGIFDTSTDIERTPDGTIILTFENCSSGTIDYDIPSIGRQGTIPIQRVANDNVSLCEALITD